MERVPGLVSSWHLECAMESLALRETSRLIPSEGACSLRRLRLIHGRPKKISEFCR
jgi:hypothetical protein